jgi:hypothetical protein
MEHHRIAAIRVDQAIFGTPSEARDYGSGQPLPEIRRKGSPQVGTPRFDACDPSAFQDSLKAADRRFDFGELWHRGRYGEG